MRRRHTLRYQVTLQPKWTHAFQFAGYNFTDFSDDLTDVSCRSRGWFINLIGKM